MKNTLILFCCALLLVGSAFGQSTEETFKNKLADMQSDDAGRVKNGLLDWQKLCFEAGAPGQGTKKTEMVALMAAALEKENLNALAKAWLIRQLGRLDNGDNAKLLGKFVADSDRTVRDEAIAALSSIPNEKSTAVLKELLGKESDVAKKTALQDALNFKAGRPKPTLPTLDGVLKVLETGDSKDWERTLPNVPWIFDAKIAAVPNVKERFDKLEPQAKTLLMDALVARRDRSALPLALLMAKSDDESVRYAGYRALGPLGGKDEMVLLLKQIRESGENGDRICDSLVRLNYDGADQQLLDAYATSKDNGVKSRLLGIFNRRKGTIFIPAFEAGLKSEDEGFRRDAVRSLEITGQQSSIPVLIDRYFVEEKKELRDEIERAIIEIESRYSDEDGRGKTFCSEIAKRNEIQQAQLIPLLGKIGGNTAVDFVRKQSKEGTPTIQDAAFKTLCNWNDASVADELFRVASSGDPQAATAAKSYIRIVTLNEHGRNDKDKLAYVEKAMSVAKSDDDKKFLLSRLDPSRCIEVFRFAVKYIDDPGLDQAACKAVVDMANDTGFHMHNRTEIEPFLDEVIEKSKDNNHVERAKRYKARR